MTYKTILNFNDTWIYRISQLNLRLKLKKMKILLKSTKEL
jgi:hypothetical protein